MGENCGVDEGPSIRKEPNEETTENVTSSGLPEGKEYEARDSMQMRAAATEAILAASFGGGSLQDDNTNRRPTIDSTQQQDDLDQPATLKKEWNDLKSNTSKTLLTCVIQSRELACEATWMLDTFVANCNFLPSFMKDRGDEDLQGSPWILDNEDTRWYKRTIQYVHPIKVPLAPSKARARKEQRYRRYGHHGFCWETRTYTEGVPVSDCFFVIDRVLVEPTTGSPINTSVNTCSGSSTVVVSAYFDVCFIKKSMFQGIVAKTTGGEFTNFLTALVDEIEESLGEVAVLVKEPIVLCQANDDAIEAPSSHFGESSVLIYLLVVMLFMVIALQLSILDKMGIMKTSIASLESQMQMRQTCSAV